MRSCFRGRTQFFKIVGFAGKRFLRSPPPPPSFMFFCSCPSFLDEPREETLATQANKGITTTTITKLCLQLVRKNSINRFSVDCLHFFLNQLKIIKRLRRLLGSYVTTLRMRVSNDSTLKAWLFEVSRDELCSDFMAVNHSHPRVLFAVAVFVM